MANVSPLLAARALGFLKAAPDATAERPPPQKATQKTSPTTLQTEVLQVGEGIFGPVSVAIWQFKVSGLPIVESWLSYRMKAGAGRSSSPLDRLRPERWTADVTRELLELLWVLEVTIAMLPELKAGFDEIISGETFGANELPRPTAEERGGVDEDEPEPEQREMNL